MRDTIATAATLARHPNVASPHAIVDGRVRVIDNVSVDPVAAAGAVWSSVDDMAKWMISLLDDAIVTKASATTMTTPTRLVDGSVLPFLGIGWFLGNSAGHRYMAHNGSTAAGFSSVVYIFPDDALGVTVLLNIDRGDAVNRLATNIAAFYLPGVGMPDKLPDK